MELASSVVAEVSFLKFMIMNKINFKYWFYQQLLVTKSSCEHVDHKVDLLKYVFYFLEILYDPYSTWRAWLAKYVLTYKIIV